MIIDYDLNIFRLEQYVGSDDENNPIYEYLDPWYVHVYEVDGLGHREASPAYELTPTESRELQLGTNYFEYEDNWYGLEGFVKDYEHQISDRLWEIFNALPVEKDN
jgi:hypothetical protein